MNQLTDETRWIYCLATKLSMRGYIYFWEYKPKITWTCGDKLAISFFLFCILSKTIFHLSLWREISTQCSKGLSNNFRYMSPFFIDWTELIFMRFSHFFPLRKKIDITIRFIYLFFCNVSTTCINCRVLIKIFSLPNTNCSYIAICVITHFVNLVDFSEARNCYFPCDKNNKDKRLTNELKT